MLQRFKVTASQLFNNPNARIIFILGTLLVAVVVGGAPNDHSGG